MNDRYAFLVSQYKRLDVVNGSVLVIAVWLPIMGLILDRIIRKHHDGWMNAWLVFSFLVYASILLYAGILNRGG